MGRLTTGTSLEDLARQALVILLSLSVFLWNGVEGQGVKEDALVRAV